MGKDVGVTPYQQRLIDSYNGKLKETCDKIGFNYQYARKLMVGKDHKLFQEAMRMRELEKRDKRIKEREEVQIFWSETIDKEDINMRDRLTASQLLEKSRGGFVDRIEVEQVATLSDEELERELKALEEYKED